MPAKSKAKPEPTVPTLKSIRKTFYPLELFQPDPENARGHDARNIRAIADSIKQFGQRIPILVDAGLVIRKGNGTWLAMKLLDRKQIWAIPLELDGPAKEAFALADNRTAELAHWEWKIVSETLLRLDQAGQDITELGFEDFELEPLLAASWKPPAIQEDAISQTPIPKDDQPTERIILATDAEFEIITETIKRMRRHWKGQQLSDGLALSLICQEWKPDEE